MNDRLAVGDRAPRFALPDPDGTIVRFEPDDHAASVLVFTANGCPFARAWHDRIQDVGREYSDRDVVLLQIISNDESHHSEDSVAGMRQRLADDDVAGPFLRDAEQSVVRAYGATATPEVFVLDGRGVVRYHGAPDADHDDPGQQARWVRNALDDVLAGRPVARPVTSPAGCSIKWRAEILWWSGCPTHEQAAELLRDALARLGRDDVPVVRREVRSRDEAERHGFVGSPTFSVGGDLFPAANAVPALTCRTYARADGRFSPLPDGDELAERLRHALARPWDLPGWVDPRTSRGADAAASGR